jgi:hypothetical protein
MQKKITEIKDNVWIIFVALHTRVTVHPRNGKPTVLECGDVLEPFQEEDKEIRTAVVNSGACRYAVDADFKKGGRE